MNRHALLVGFNNQLNHLIVVVEALHTVIAGLVQIILVLPTRVCLGHTIEERLGSDNMEILTTQFGTLCGNAGNLCLRIGNIVGNIHVSVGTHLQACLPSPTRSRLGENRGRQSPYQRHRLL